MAWRSFQYGGARGIFWCRSSGGKMQQPIFATQRHSHCCCRGHPPASYTQTDAVGGVRHETTIVVAPSGTGCSSLLLYVQYQVSPEMSFFNFCLYLGTELDNQYTVRWTRLSHAPLIHGFQQTRAITAYELVFRCSDYLCFLLPMFLFIHYSLRMTS